MFEIAVIIIAIALLPAALYVIMLAGIILVRVAPALLSIILLVLAIAIAIAYANAASTWVF